ncbi:DNA alkylation repair protein [Wenyingzhuangia sp. IMCC45574]
MNPEILNRKGARKAQDIPNEVLELLNQGKIETVNLTEWLAIDFVLLIETTFPTIGVSKNAIDRLIVELKAQKKPTTMNSTKLVGNYLYETCQDTPQLENILTQLSCHTSDAIRCFAPYLIGLNSQLTIKEKLNKAKGIIADSHFGVREVVWMALRPEITEHIEETIEILSTWTIDADENIRRFTTEATRPRGVWCKHIDVLKEQPALALPILEPLKADTSKYVQDSVGNWLNDASKTQPNFVTDLCATWETASPTKETAKIIKRGMRSIEKK